jgi:putative FmdB family regulatory protein
VPFYEYRCVKGHTFEVTQRMSEDPLTTCEVCGAEASRVLFAPAIHFKGTGFHNTDYGSKRRGTGGDEGGSAAGSTSGDAATSSNGDSGGASSGSAGSGGDTSSSKKTVGLDKV